MSERVTRIYEEAQHVLERYQRFMPETVDYLKNDMSREWNDDVGSRAVKSLTFISNDWYTVVSSELGGISAALLTIQKICRELSDLKEEAERAALAAEKVISRG